MSKRMVGQLYQSIFGDAKMIVTGCNTPGFLQAFYSNSSSSVDFVKAKPMSQKKFERKLQKYEFQCDVEIDVANDKCSIVKLIKEQRDVDELRASRGKNGIPD
jgi:hypothetical protein